MIADTANRTVNRTNTFEHEPDIARREREAELVGQVGRRGQADKSFVWPGSGSGHIDDRQGKAFGSEGAAAPDVQGDTSQ